MENISKKTGAILILLAIFLTVIITFGILNYTKLPKAIEGAKESASGGQVSLTIIEPPQIEDENTGSVSLELLPPGG